ncbi:DUF1579 domain-containing protein [Crateriforma conspicua]|uniref:DUF1579 domain-containing protein n=1 Tax=Crateriforma conspicua TaxID=2527996 RepID=A0A5C6FVE8_9PLAN|nr:DUF1579 domain-containing protein [Crateriforma conspicua]TWU66296.1 hypothetical protein V7x_18590 [Crateriforma conspicua]
MSQKTSEPHQWLKQLVGHWTFHHECINPDGSKMQVDGRVDCRMLGNLWLVCEYSGGSGDDQWSSIMALGYDTAKSAYVGSFVASMMDNLWLYQGDRSEAGNAVVLETEGPKFDGSGTCPYRDTIKIIDADCWQMTSEMQDDEGNWICFMNGTQQRDG